MTTTRADLFAHIMAHPDDDDPRLVFADYLEETGELPRAMLIRRQCELARLQPWDRRHREASWEVAALLAQHGPAWRAELPALDGIAWTEFHRGFCSTVRAAELAALYEHRAAIGAAAPVFRAELDRVVETEPFPADGIPWLRVVRFATVGWETSVRDKDSIVSAGSELELDLPEYDSAEWLARRRDDRPVTRLTMTGEHTTGLAFAQRLAEAAWAKSVRTLELGTEFVDMDTGYFEDPTMREAGARAIAGGHFIEVEKLSLANQRVGADGLAAILGTMPALVELAAARCELEQVSALGEVPGAPLVALDLSHNPIGDGGVGALGAQPRMAKLEQLVLRACGLTGAGLGKLVAAPCWQTLRALDLGQSELGVDGAGALVDAPEPAHLVSLVLDDCDLDADAARLIAKIPWFAELFALELAKNPIAGSAELLAAIADSELRAIGLRACGIADPSALAPAWGRACTLDLRGNPIGDAGLAALVTDEESPIVELDLADCGLTPASLATFARMRTPRLRVLRLGKNAFAQAADTSAMLVDLIRLPFFQTVEDLDVSYCGFKNDLVTKLGMGGSLRALQTFRARGHHLPEQALFALAGLTNVPNLTQVKVDGNVWQIRDEAKRKELAAKFGPSWWYDPQPSAAYGYGNQGDD